MGQPAPHREVRRTGLPGDREHGGDPVVLVRRGALLRLIAGEVDGRGGPGSTCTPITMAHATLQPGAQLDLAWRRDFNALVYVLAGRGTVGPVGHPIHQGQLAVLGPGDRTTVAANRHQDSPDPAMEVLLMGGKPIREPVFHYGPFVMNTKAEVIRALEDYRSGRFGAIHREPSDRTAFVPELGHEFRRKRSQGRNHGDRPVARPGTTTVLGVAAKPESPFVRCSGIVNPEARDSFSGGRRGLA